MKEEIIAAITAYLQRETVVTGSEIRPVIAFEGLNAGHFTHTGFCKEIAEEIFEKIRQSVAASIISEVELVARKEAKYRVVHSDGVVQYIREKPVFPKIQEMKD